MNGFTIFYQDEGGDQFQIDIHNPYGPQEDVLHTVMEALIGLGYNDVHAYRNIVHAETIYPGVKALTPDPED